MPHLAHSSTGWASQASLAVAVVNMAQTGVKDAPKLTYSEFSAYDLGLAVAHMALQAVAMDFQAHQFRAFKRVHHR